MSATRLKVAVLISGTGSNLKTLIDAVHCGRLDINICLVICNKPGAPGLDHARNAGIAIALVTPQQFPTGSQQDREITRLLLNCGAELVVLAGYMRILGTEPVNRFKGRMINLHPSLLPLYPGLDTYRRALESGDNEHGGSIHFVTSELDGGPVISQVRIPVNPGDSPAALAARLSPREHLLLLATVELFTRNRVEMCPGGVMLDQVLLSQPLELNHQGKFD